jgi:hypothetical protein
VRSFSLPLVIVMQFVVSAALAQPIGSSPCTVEDSKRAFDAVDKLHSWGAVLNFYKMYLPCDDGGIAEGVSDAITKLLANDWAGFWRLSPTLRAEPQFQQFVFRHIDATVPVETLRGIGRNARSRCPQKFALLCKKIDDATSSAIKESGQ